MRRSTALLRIAAVAALLVAYTPVQAQTETSPAEAPPLDDAVHAAIDASPVARQTYWGILAVQASTGKVLASLNGENWFVPASNAKLFSTALALTKLGAGYTFETTVTAHTAPVQGRVDGDLVLRGGGDPTLTGRRYPYKGSDTDGDPLTALNELADQVVAAGVRRVDGDIVGDDTRYLWFPYPDGWGVDDDAFDYGAGVSALAVNDSTVRVVIRPAHTAGEVARVTMQPDSDCVEILNHVVTTAARGQRVEARRLPHSGAIELYGGISLSDGAVVKYLTADDPARFAACLLRNALEERGVQVMGEARAVHLWTADKGRSGAKEPVTPADAVLARRVSPPLGQILAAVNKESLNLHAEMLLLESAFAATGVGNREKGLKELQRYLDSIGIDGAGYTLEDGSGLSRLALVSPDAVTRLLTALYASPDKDVWMQSLAVGGKDGTLEKRFVNVATGRVRGKTGTLTHVSALSGYAESKTYGTVVFSILANNYNAPAGTIRSVVDKIVMEILR